MRSENAFLWLKEGSVDSQTCDMVMAVQDAAIRVMAWQARFVECTDRCRVCGNGRETLGHIIAMCQPHQWTLYKPKHDEVARCIQWSVARALDLVVQSESRTVHDVVNGNNDSILGPTLPEPTANDGAEARSPSVALSGEITLYHRSRDHEQPQG